MEQRAEKLYQLNLTIQLGFEQVRNNVWLRATFFKYYLFVYFSEE